MSERYVCIHGHFYQPPRENAWLEEIEQQVTAYPFHDWNERITHECYGPNAEARVLDWAGRLSRVCSNYARISYNFGPTLLSWMERASPAVHAAVVAADRASAARFGGHGSAMAQGYNHVIMPLANERDRRTQARWGVADFVHRFGRRPEGMWLPECAADVPTLETLAAEGIAFTVMAPGQCAATRPAGRSGWEECGPGGADPRRAYRVSLPSGRSIAVFFYDGPIAQAVAFERLLDDGRRLAGRLLGAFGDGNGPEARLVHIATDGESYGHHHRFGEMALASALDQIEADPGVRLTNYAQFLAEHGTAGEALVREPSAWSCAHGVGRWSAACGCGTGENPGWNQAWRGPLRDALDWLRDELAGAFESGTAGLLRDPWAARDGYIGVLLRPGQESRGRFLGAHAARPLSEAEAGRAMGLLESQRQAMLMYTSCAWFFDELSGIETVQVLQYAARAMELVESATGRALGEGFAARLALAQSNVPERGTGADVLGTLVMPGRVGPERVLASEMVRRVAERDGEPIGAGVWEVSAAEGLAIDRGSTHLRAGTARVGSVRTGQAWEFEYGLIVHGERLVRCGVGAAGADFGAGGTGGVGVGSVGVGGVARALAEHLEAHGPEGAAGYVLERFGHGASDRARGAVFEVGGLVVRAQQAITRRVLSSTLRQLDATYRLIYKQNAGLARFLGGQRIAPPRRLLLPMELVLNGRVEEALEERTPDPRELAALFWEARQLMVPLDAQSLSHAALRAVRRLAAQVRAHAGDAAWLERVAGLVRIAPQAGFGVDLGPLQVECWRLRRELRATGEIGGAGGGGGAFEDLCASLMIAADSPDEQGHGGCPLWEDRGGAGARPVNDQGAGAGRERA